MNSKNNPAQVVTNDDILQRLRDSADLDGAEHGNARVVQLEREAAGEIERLRGELPKLRAHIAREAQPAAYLTLDEEGSPCMLFFDVVEARSYCALGEVPEPLFRHAAPQASAEARPNNDAVDLARAGMALHAPGTPEHTVCAELVRLADVLKQPQEGKDAALCTCPSGDGSLRHPCAERPQTEACKKER